LSNTELRIIAPDPREHGERLARLCAEVFAGMGYYDILRDYRTVYLHGSHYDWNTTRIGMIGDRIVTHFGVFGYQMRIGRARVRVGGVGGVATDGEFRKRGYMAATAAAALAAMREAGYHLTILFGIGNFYHRFGYVRAWAETDFYVKTADLPQERPALRARRFAPRPRADIERLYNRFHATTTGTAVRPTYRKGYPFWVKPQDGYLWRDANGELAGYVMVARRGHQLQCHEYCGDAEQALRVLSAIARRHACDTVHFRTLPYFSDLARLLRQGSCRAETRYRWSGGAMIQVLNLRSTLAAMEVELSHRLRNSPIAGWTGNLLVADDRERVGLDIKSERVKVAEPQRTRHTIRGGRHIAQLLLGTERPQEVVAGGGIRLSGDARTLVEVLFPEQGPMLAALDRY